MPIIAAVPVSTLPLQAVARDGLQTAADISLIVMAVGAGVTLIAVALILVQIRKLLAALNDQLKPVTDRARVAAENVEYISAVIREDVQKVNRSVSSITEQLNEASEHMEERVSEFNALMEVVQDEAERVFIDTAAVVRGVQAGARSVAGEATEEPTPELPVKPHEDALPEGGDSEPVALPEPESA